MVRNSSISIIMPSMMVLGLRRPPGGGQKFYDFCLILMFLAVVPLNDRAYANDFAIWAIWFQNRLWNRWIGKVCSCAPCSTLSLCVHRWRHHRLSTLKIWSNLGLFAEGRERWTGSDEIWNGSIHHGSTMQPKFGPQRYKGRGIGDLKFPKLVKIAVFRPSVATMDTDQSEIWQAEYTMGPFSCKVCPWSVKRIGDRSPQNSKFGQNRGISECF